jgi:hypothetical protein
MPQSKKLVTSSRYSFPVSWTGAIAIGFLLWSFLVWAIWQVSVGLF